MNNENACLLACFADSLQNKGIDSTKQACYVARQASEAGRRDIRAVSAVTGI